MFKLKKGQASIEYLLILGAVILFVAVFILVLTGIIDFGLEEHGTSQEEYDRQIECLLQLAEIGTYFEEDFESGDEWWAFTVADGATTELGTYWSVQSNGASKVMQKSGGECTTCSPSYWDVGLITTKGSKTNETCWATYATNYIVEADVKLYQNGFPSGDHEAGIIVRHAPGAAGTDSGYNLVLYQAAGKCKFKIRRTNAGSCQLTILDKVVYTDWRGCYFDVGDTNSFHFKVHVAGDTFTVTLTDYFNPGWSKNWAVTDPEAGNPACANKVYKTGDIGLVSFSTQPTGESFAEFDNLKVCGKRGCS